MMSMNRGLIVGTRAILFIENLYQQYSRLLVILTHTVVTGLLSS